MTDRRKEPRIRVRLSVQITGVDNQGKRFVEHAVATSLSRSGALLSDVEVGLRCGDYLAVRYGARRANFRIIWIQHSDGPLRGQMAVQKLENQPCPWEEVLADGLARPVPLETRYADLDCRLRECWGMDFKQSPVPMWVFDRSTLAFLAVNESALRIYGYTREDFLAMTILDIRPQEDVRAVLNAALRPHEVNGELERWQHRRKDGVVMNVELSARPLIFEGRPAELITVSGMEPSAVARNPEELPPSRPR